MESAAEVSAWTRSLQTLQRRRQIQEAGAPATPARIVRAGWRIAVLAVGMQTAAELTNALALAHRHPALDAGVDRNVFDWMSFCAALAAALSLVVGAKAASEGRRSTALLALFVAFLAVDDLVNLHDRLGKAFAHTLPQPLDRVGDWSTPLLYMPLLATTFALLLWRGRLAAPPAARQIRTALVLLAGAIALRVVVGILEILGIHASDGIRAIGVAVLQGAELGAWILLAAAFVAESAIVIGRGRKAAARG